MDRETAKELSKLPIVHSVSIQTKDSYREGELKSMKSQCFVHTRGSVSSVEEYKDLVTTIKKWIPGPLTKELSGHDVNLTRRGLTVFISVARQNRLQLLSRIFGCEIEERVHYGSRFVTCHCKVKETK